MTTPGFKDNVDPTMAVEPGRIALGIEYMGANYCGWQRQSNASSVQAHVENSLKKILLHEVNIVCAGRTDAGVNAVSQIVHFDSQVIRPLKAFTRGLNTHLPKDIAITWAQAVPNDFHARFSASARRYRYIIYNNPLRSGLLNAGLTHVYQALDADKMHEAAKALCGEQDFSAFRAAHCQSNTPYRHIHYINVSRQNRYIIVDVKANAFLHHMVRNIVGSLIDVGCGEKPLSYISDLLASKDRTKASATAKPNGLYLVQVDYPKEFGLQSVDLGPLFLDDA